MIEGVCAVRTVLASRKAYSKSVLQSRSCWRRKDAFLRSLKRETKTEIVGGMWLMWIVSTNAIAFARCGHLSMHAEGRICMSIIVIPSAQAL